MCYSTHVTEFTLTLESGASNCDQAVYAAKKALVSGQMRPGESFPSVRSLSTTLKINPGYLAAYDLPKIANLKAMFPDVWREKPYVVFAENAS